MMGTEHGVIFCQRDFVPSSFRTFEEMRWNSELIDFKITFQNKSFSGHRLVLAAAIPYFRTIFHNPDKKEIILQEIEWDVLESVMRFAYTGKIEISGGNVLSLLLASELLQLSRINDACLEFLEEILNANNVWAIRDFAENRRCTKLVDLVDRHIRQNFEAFSKTESFLAVPFLYLKEVLRRNDVEVSSEENVFEAVIRWVKEYPSVRKGLLTDLLSAVRLSHLSPDYLIESVSKDELVHSSIPCRDLVDEAKLYHWSPGKLSKIRRFETRPRIYERKPEYRTCGGNTNICDALYALCSSGSSLSIQLLDVVNKKWIRLSTFEFSGQIKYAAVFNDAFYIFVEDGRTLTVDMKSAKLTPLETAPERPRFCSITVKHNSRFYIFGIINDIHCFDPEQKKWNVVGKMREPRPCAMAASLTEYVYITGGFLDGRNSNTAVRYNPTKNEWSDISPMLCNRWSHGCTSLNGKIYVCTGLPNTAEVYDPLTDQWNYIAPMSKTKFQLTLCPFKGKLHVVGPTLSSSNDIQIYDPEQDKWKFHDATFKDCNNCETLPVIALLPSTRDIKGFNLKIPVTTSKRYSAFDTPSATPEQSFQTQANTSSTSIISSLVQPSVTSEGVSIGLPSATATETSIHSALSARATNTSSTSIISSLVQPSVTSRGLPIGLHSATATETSIHFAQSAGVTNTSTTSIISSRLQPSVTSGGVSVGLPSTTAAETGIHFAQSAPVTTDFTGFTFEVPTASTGTSTLKFTNPGDAASSTVTTSATGEDGGLTVGVVKPSTTSATITDFSLAIPKTFAPVISPVFTFCTVSTPSFTTTAAPKDTGNFPLRDSFGFSNEKSSAIATASEDAFNFATPRASTPEITSKFTVGIANTSSLTTTVALKETGDLLGGSPGFGNVKPATTFSVGDAFKFATPNSAPVNTSGCTTGSLCAPPVTTAVASKESGNLPLGGSLIFGNGKLDAPNTAAEGAVNFAIPKTIAPVTTLGFAAGIPSTSSSSAGSKDSANFPLHSDCGIGAATAASGGHFSFAIPKTTAPLNTSEFTFGTPSTSALSAAAGTILFTIGSYSKPSF